MVWWLKDGGSTEVKNSEDQCCTREMYIYIYRTGGGETSVDEGLKQTLQRWVKKGRKCRRKGSKKEGGCGGGRCKLDEAGRRRSRKGDKVQ